MNFDDNDEPSLPFDRAGLREFDQTSDSLVNPLYASMREEDEYVSDQGHVNKLLTFTGSVFLLSQKLPHKRMFQHFN